LRRTPVSAPIVALVALAALLASPGGAGAAARAAAPPPLTYVAMGDSYSAASGVLPVDPRAPQCLRSTRHYPSVVAAATGAQLVDVTCGAAETRHFFEPQHPGMRPQLAALSRDTDLVTMTIGGNDSGVFISAILACGTAGLSTVGTGSPCKNRYGTSFVDTIRSTTFPALVRALRAVRARAPRADVAIIGYPWIMPRTTGCFPLMPVAVGDVPYLRNLQRELNDAVRRAATRTGATYVDLSRASEGHDACQRPSRRWVEPALGGTNPAIVHPNAAGERQMGLRTLRALGLD